MSKEVLVKNTLIKLFHLLAALQFFYGLYYEVYYVLPEELKLRKFSFGGKMIYLTFIDAIIHACYHSIAFVNDFVGTNEAQVENPPMIRKVRDYIFASFCFPLGLNVSLLFWSLYSIDRELVFPTIMEQIYPWWLNHILHTNVFLLTAVEMLILFHFYPRRKLELFGLMSFIVIYIGWVHIVKLVADSWVYPVLDVLDIHHRYSFFLLAGTIPIGFYFVGEFLNKEIWTKRRFVYEKLHQN